MLKIKILAIFFSLGLLTGGYFLYTNNLLKTLKKNSLNSIEKSVKGAETYSQNSLNLNPNLNSNPSSYKLNAIIPSLQAQVQNLNLVQIATASPQIQQIIQQIQNLPQAPINQAKNTCIELCNKL